MTIQVAAGWQSLEERRISDFQLRDRESAASCCRLGEDQCFSDMLTRPLGNPQVHMKFGPKPILFSIPPEEERTHAMAQMTRRSYQGATVN